MKPRAKPGTKPAGKKDDLFLQPDKLPGSFEFNADVAEVFDDMLLRSVPFYREQQGLIADIVKRMWIPGTKIYDLGCSTGTTLIGLGRQLPPSARLVGYDNSPAMLQRAERNIATHRLHRRVSLHLADLNGPLADLPLRRAGAVTLCWTLMFVRPLKRDNLIRWIHDSLEPQGVLIVAEKILTNSGHMNRLFTDIYYDFKRQEGYSEMEIARKREALENVLVPYRIEENLDLFRRNGFVTVETFFQWFNFVGFLCVRKSS